MESMHRKNSIERKPDPEHQTALLTSAQPVAENQSMFNSIGLNQNGKNPLLLKTQPINSQYTNRKLENTKNYTSENISNIIPDKYGVYSGEQKMPAVKYFIKQSEFDDLLEKPTNPFPPPAESAKTGTATSAGSETESETVVGSFAATSSDTKIKQQVKGGPKLTRLSQKKYKENAIQQNPYIQSFVKPFKDNSVPPSGTQPTSKTIDIINVVHNDLPSYINKIHRPVSSVSDIVSDSSSQDFGTQTTSNYSSNKSSNATSKEAEMADSSENTYPFGDKVHRFVGSIKLDDSKMFYISGTTSADQQKFIFLKNMNNKMVSTSNNKEPNSSSNILSRSRVRSSAPLPKFEERSRIEESKTDIIRSRIGESPFVHLSMMADPVRARKTKIESPLADLNGMSNSTIIAPRDDSSKRKKIVSSKLVKDKIFHRKYQLNPVKKSKIASLETDSGDLGSIITLVGKVDNDRTTSKRTKHHNLTDESNAQKKTVNKDHMSLKHLPHNNSASETNAANVDQIQGPSNSIIVSSAIIVLVVSVVVVSMVVVAVAAVIAKQCRLGKQLEAN